MHVYRYACICYSLTQNSLTDFNEIRCVWCWTSEINPDPNFLALLAPKITGAVILQTLNLKRRAMYNIIEI